MKKGLIVLGFGFLLVACSNQTKSPNTNTAEQNNVKPPASISCKDYCKNECQGMAASCETNCLNACYPPPGTDNTNSNQTQNTSK